MATDPTTNKIRLGEFLEAEILKRVLQFQETEPQQKTTSEMIMLLLPVKIIADSNLFSTWETLLLMEFERLELIDRSQLPLAFQHRFSVEAKYLLETMQHGILIQSQLLQDFCQRILAMMIELKIPSQKLEAISHSFDSHTQNLVASLWPVIHSWERERPKQLWINPPPSEAQNLEGDFLLHCQLDLDFSPLPPDSSKSQKK